VGQSIAPKSVKYNLNGLPLTMKTFEPQILRCGNLNNKFHARIGQPKSSSQLLGYSSGPLRLNF